MLSHEEGKWNTKHRYLLRVDIELNGGMTNRLRKEEISDLLDDFEGVEDATDPKGVDWAANGTGNHEWIKKLMVCWNGLRGRRAAVLCNGVVQITSDVLRGLDGMGKVLYGEDGARSDMEGIGVVFLNQDVFYLKEHLFSHGNIFKN